MPTIERGSGPIARAILRRSRPVLAAFLAATALLGWHAPRMEIDASAETLLTKDNPHYIRTRVVHRRFSPREFLLVAYEPREGSIFSAETLAALRALSADLKRLDRVASVSSMLNVPIPAPSTDALAGGLDLGERTIERGGYSLSEIRRAFTDHPVYEDLLVNKSQTATALQVAFRPDPELEELYARAVRLQEKSLTEELSQAERAELEGLKARAEPIERRLDRVRVAEIEAIRGMVAPYEKDARIYLGGVHVLGYQLIRIIKNDLAVFGAAVAGMICLVLAALFRRPRWVAAPLLCAACSILSTMGLFALLGFKTTVISSSFISLQLVLTLALVMHLIVQYREHAAARPDWPQETLVERTLARKAPPLLYAGLTTSVGFGSLVFSGIQPVISFGWMMIIAMFISIAVSLVLFPSMMALLGKEPAPRGGRLAARFLGFFARLSGRRPLGVAAAAAALLAASVAGLLRLEVENSFIHYFRESTVVRRELAYIDREFGGSTPLDVIYTVPEAHRERDLVLTAEAVRTAQRIQAALERRRAVGKTLSIVNLTELAKRINGGRPLTEYELTAAYWLLEESFRDDLVGSFFHPERAQLRFSVRIQDTTEGLNRERLLAGIREDLEGLGIPPERYVLTSLFVLYQDIMGRLLRSQVLTGGLVYAVMFLTFLAVFRSLRVALIAITPNVLTTLPVVGAMGWLGVPLDIMTITIVAIAMGIVVDNTIHYTHRYLEELRARGREEALARSHATVGHAMLYTALVVTIGFSLLGFSDFMPSALFGLLTGLAMVLGLLADLALLPALLKAFGPAPAPGVREVV